MHGSTSSCGKDHSKVLKLECEYIWESDICTNSVMCRWFKKFVSAENFLVHDVFTEIDSTTKSRYSSPGLLQEYSTHAGHFSQSFGMNFLIFFGA